MNEECENLCHKQGSLLEERTCDECVPWSLFKIGQMHCMNKLLGIKVEIEISCADCIISMTQGFSLENMRPH